MQKATNLMVNAGANPAYKSATWVLGGLLVILITVLLLVLSVLRRRRQGNNNVASGHCMDRSEQSVINDLFQNKNSRAERHRLKSLGPEAHFRAPARIPAERGGVPGHRTRASLSCTRKETAI